MYSKSNSERAKNRCVSNDLISNGAGGEKYGELLHRRKVHRLLISFRLPFANRTTYKLSREYGPNEKHAYKPHGGKRHCPLSLFTR